VLHESTDYVRLLLRKLIQAERGWWTGIQLSAEVLISVLGRLSCHGGFASVVSSRRGILCVGSPKVTLASVLEALPSERVAERYVPGEITSPRSGSLGTQAESQLSAYQVCGQTTWRQLLTHQRSR